MVDLKKSSTEWPLPLTPKYLDDTERAASLGHITGTDPKDTTIVILVTEVRRLRAQGAR